MTNFSRSRLSWFLAILISGCALEQLDSLFSFVSDGGGEFWIPQTITTAQDSSYQVAIPIQEALAKEKVGAQNVQSAKVTRLQIVATDPANYPANGVATATVMVGADTIATLAVPDFTVDTITFEPRDVQVKQALASLDSGRIDFRVILQPKRAPFKSELWRLLTRIEIIADKS